MIEDDALANHSPRLWWGPASAVVAIAVFVWQAIVGWFEVVFGTPGVFWATVGLWLVLSVFAVRKRQHWWIIPTAPLVLYPLVLFGVFAAECMRGNCL